MEATSDGVSQLIKRTLSPAYFLTIKGDRFMSYHADGYFLFGTPSDLGLIAAGKID